MSGDWQKNLRNRGFRLIAYSLPLLILSLVASSLVTRRPPLILIEADLKEVQMKSGRFILPTNLDGPIPVILEFQWPERPPKDLKFDLQISDPEGQDRLQKKIHVKSQGSRGHWQQTLSFSLTASPIQNYSLTTLTRTPVATHFRLTAFAGTKLNRLLRFGEMLLFPALAFVILAISMVLFPSIINLRE